MTNTESHKIAGIGLAGGAVVSALLDTLYTKGILTLDESRGVLDMAIRAIGPHTRTAEGYEASQIIAALLRGRFTARGQDK